ncbi:MULTISPECIES: hypothetical protein [unclassified Bartonella]|uniref:hypothetical protein n=1 Tax=unclassified Bartonella TaxID=2645622 RepID=UPI0035D03BF5
MTLRIVRGFILIVDGFMGTISQLTDFCKSLPHRMKGWIGSIDVREFLPSFLGGKTAIQPIPQFAGASPVNSFAREQRDKDRSPITHNQNVTVHVNGARDPVAHWSCGCPRHSTGTR